jgi:hypothetical protein
MAKRLISFRMEENRIEELRELADVYTNGNATELVEYLIRRMYFLEPLALSGKYRTSGFGVAGETRRMFQSAWNIWINEGLIQVKPDIAQANINVNVTINGDCTSLKRSEIRDLANILRIPIDTRCVYTISVKKDPRD